MKYCTYYVSFNCISPDMKCFIPLYNTLFSECVLVLSKNVGDVIVQKRAFSERNDLSANVSYYH